MQRNTEMSQGRRTETDAGTQLRAQVPEQWNVVTERIIGLAMEVHSVLGPGLLERLYEDAMVHELECAGMRVQRQYPVRLRYKEIELGEQRLDLVVNELIVIELKSIEKVSDVHLAQLVSYLRSAKLPLGLLINFNVPRLKEGLFRRINPAACPPCDVTQSSSSSASL